MSRLPRTFRNDAYPVLGWTFMIFALCCLSGAWAVRGNLDDGFIFVPLGILAVMFCWRGYIRPRIIADVGGVTVVNVLSTHVVPWSDIERFQAFDLLTVFLRPERGGQLAVWAVQAANAARLTGRRSRADDVADELNALLHAATSGEGPASAG